ncbi:hypothetical protein PM082_024046 [Marasmius tenuissimus]|nr:hypothetical protein PM082_024046 [Marasmius tenuissimus]
MNLHFRDRGDDLYFRVISGGGKGKLEKTNKTRFQVDSDPYCFGSRLKMNVEYHDVGLNSTYPVCLQPFPRKIVFHYLNPHSHPEFCGSVGCQLRNPSTSELYFESNNDTFPIRYDELTESRAYPVKPLEFLLSLIRDIRSASKGDTMKRFGSKILYIQVTGAIETEAWVTSI